MVDHMHRHLLNQRLLRAKYVAVQWLTSFASDLRIVPSTPPPPPPPGGYSTKFYTSKLRLGVQSLIILYTNFERKRFRTG